MDDEPRRDDRPQMNYDGIALRACLNDLRTRASDTRVQRIVQLSPLSAAISLHGSPAVWLVCSAEAPAACLFAAETPPGPAVEPTPFCTCLRRHLLGSRLTAISQEGWDRVAVLRFAGRSALGDPVSCDLVVELMGKHSNLICVREDGRIADAAKRIGKSRSRFRQVLPGYDYLPPPAQDKLPPDGVTGADLRQAATTPGGHGPHAAGDGPHAAGDLTPGRLVRVVAGIGAARAAAVLAAPRGRQGEAGVTWESLATELRDAAARVISGAGSAVERDRAAEAFAAYLAGTSRPAGRGSGPRFAAQGTSTAGSHAALLSTLCAAVAAEADGVRRRIRRLQAQLDSGPDPEVSLHRGNTLLTALGELRQRQEKASREGLDEISVSLPGFSVRLRAGDDPVALAQEEFKSYSSARRAREALHRLLEDAEDRLGHLEQLSYQLQHDPPETAEDLEETLEDAGRLGVRPNRPAAGGATRRGRHRATAPRPPAVTSPGGLEVLVGRNNRENDRLLRIGKPGDLWFHARGVPGAHVLLKMEGGKEIAREDLLFAAGIAAGRSRAAGSAKVSVDVAPLDRVRREKGRPPGFVRYSGEETVQVAPLAVPLSRRRSWAASGESPSCSTGRRPEDTREPTG